MGQATLLSLIVLADVALFTGIAFAPARRSVSRRYTTYIALNLLILVGLFVAYVGVVSQAHAAIPINSTERMSSANGF